MSLRVLVVDDEPLARARLRTLLAECGAPAVARIEEAGDAAEAQALAQRQPFDVALLDIHMPGVDGLQLAAALRRLPQAPRVVFVTAHAEHALQAFEVEALDYLTKPVRLERLRSALLKVERRLPEPSRADAAAEWLVASERGRTQRVPLHEVLYLRAESKYVIARTAQARLWLDDSLNQLQARHPGRWLRIHRNALVAPAALRALVRAADAGEGEGWAVRLAGVDELLPVSRRQLAAVRQVLGG